MLMDPLVVVDPSQKSPQLMDPMAQMAVVRHCGRTVQRAHSWVVRRADRLAWVPRRVGQPFAVG